jgi:hypothetical protein
VRKWEYDDREPLASGVVALATALGVTTDELLGMPQAEPDAPPATPTEGKPKGKGRK